MILIRTCGSRQAIQHHDYCFVAWNLLLGTEQSEANNRLMHNEDAVSLEQMSKAGLISRLKSLEGRGTTATHLLGRETADAQTLAQVNELQDLKAALDAHSIVAIT